MSSAYEVEVGVVCVGSMSALINVFVLFVYIFYCVCFSYAEGVLGMAYGASAEDIASVCFVLIRTIISRPFPLFSPYLCYCSPSPILVQTCHAHPTMSEAFKVISMRKAHSVIRPTHSSYPAFCVILSAPHS